VACENAQFEIAEIILSKKVDVNQVGGEKKCTPLHAAAKTGRLPLIAMLLLQPGVKEFLQRDDNITNYFYLLHRLLWMYRIRMGESRFNMLYKQELKYIRMSKN